MFLTSKTLVFSIMAEGYFAGDILCAHAWAEHVTDCFWLCQNISYGDMHPLAFAYHESWWVQLKLYITHISNYSNSFQCKFLVHHGVPLDITKDLERKALRRHQMRYYLSYSPLMSELFVLSLSLSKVKIVFHQDPK